VAEAILRRLDLYNIDPGMKDNKSGWNAESSL
jgi:hypothetical protein